MINGKADEVEKELFQSLLLMHQIGLETSVRGSVHLSYYKCHKISFKNGGS